MPKGQKNHTKNPEVFSHFGIFSHNLDQILDQFESFLRAGLALEVFRERGLISQTVQEDKMTVCLNPIQGKVDLFACPYLARLRDANR